jgi:hypothetical protein
MFRNRSFPNIPFSKRCRAQLIPSLATSVASRIAIQIR